MPKIDKEIIYYHGCKGLHKSAKQYHRFVMVTEEKYIPVDTITDEIYDPVSNIDIPKDYEDIHKP